MSDRVLPVLVSVPHGGRRCPPELGGSVALNDADVFADGDAFTDEIYDLTGLVAHVEIARVARAFVDLNRAPGDRPPDHPDGVVKSTTCHGVRVYRDGAQPDDEMVERLLARHHRPYHDALETAAKDPDLVVAVDCHSMEPYPPPIAPDRGRARPAFCISNGDHTTCSPAVLRAFGDAVAAAFAISRTAVAENDPFSGGYVTRRHGTGSALPWIQLEMNRSWYLADPWFDPGTRTLDPARVEWLRGRFLDALARVASVPDA